MKIVKLNYTLFYKEHFYKQRQAKIGKNLNKRLMIKCIKMII